MSTAHASLYRGERRHRMNKQPIEREAGTVGSPAESELTTTTNEDHDRGSTGEDRRTRTKGHGAKAAAGSKQRLL